MHYHVYFPEDLLPRRKDTLYMIGHRIRNSYVVVQVSEEDLENIIGCLNGDVDGSLRDTTSKKSWQKYHQNFPTEMLNLHYNKEHNKLAAIEDGNTYTIVTFIPPKFRNLEYFSVRPILLQSTGYRAKNHSLMDVMAQFRVSGCPDQVSISDDVLDKINLCQKTRASMKKTKAASPKTLLAVRNISFLVLHFLVLVVLSVAVNVVRVLNFPIYGTSFVHLSAWCKQLDLRMRQIAFFPVQFLCYYDPSILINPNSNMLEKLKLPVSNESLNINNSNYINLYNSIWLIVNDMLFGVTAHRLYMRYLKSMMPIVNTTLNNLVFVRLHNLVTWVGSDHPAGFKLNNELGQFFGSMFVWTLEAWQSFFVDFLQIKEFSPALHLVFAASCYCGFSFMIAMVVDYTRLVSLHVYFFNLVTTKIYYRQVEVLKSLLQLFRGRKYNSLRHRIDKLDEDQFHVDQLLLGTFIFTILVYLLPTTFAFYVLFFAIRVSILSALKLGNKILVVLNLYPIFVILLKLKNSRRLQGGIYFQSQGSGGNTNWLRMANKALTYDEILGNFIYVFRQEGQFVRLALNFLEGIQVEVRNTQAMKFLYLMLPGDYESPVPVWTSTRALG